MTTKNIPSSEPQMNERARAGLYDTVWPLEHADTWSRLSLTVDRGSLAVDRRKASSIA